MNRQEIEKRKEEYRQRSKLSPDETERIVDAWANASLANYEISRERQRKIRAGINPDTNRSYFSESLDEPLGIGGYIVLVIAIIILIIILVSFISSVI